VTNFREGLQVRTVATDLYSNRYFTPPIVDVAEDGSFEIKFVRPGETVVQISPFWLYPGDAPDGASVVVQVEPGEVVKDVALDAVEE